ncbi:MAG: hypothetical protein FD131_2247 [Rhodocyclaceae bacterium]|nr:MAG: hypothetical protein FD131_2247 [Rhodocyclaceae bacterium]
MNGFSDFRDMASTYCGDGPVSSFIDAEINLSRFSRQTNFAYPGAQELLHHLTWYGAQVKLGEMAWQRIEGLAKGNVGLTLGTSVFPDSAVLGYCPSCRECDFQHYGMTYWHRLHQLPIVFFCPIHGDRVVRVRIKRSFLHKEFPVPGDFESDQNSSEPKFSLNENFWRGVAVMAAEVLQGAELPDADLMFSVMADELRRRKFVPPLSGGRLTALSEQLAAQALDNPSATRSPETVVFLKRIARSFDEPAAGMVLGRIVLLYWLFGELATVRERCRWLSVFGSESEISLPKAATIRTKLEAQYRRACTAYIKAHPECTRLDFQRAEYRNFRWLLHNDKIWLDRQLPIPHRGGKQFVLF